MCKTFNKNSTLTHERFMVKVIPSAQFELCEQFLFNEDKDESEQYTQCFSVNVIDSLTLKLYLDGTEIAEEQFNLKDLIQEYIDEYAYEITTTGLKNLLDGDEALAYLYYEDFLHNDPILYFAVSNHIKDNGNNVLKTKFTLDELKNAILNLDDKFNDCVTRNYVRCTL